jgi:hypothetical protein
MTQPFDATAVIHSLSTNKGPNHPDTDNTDTVTILEHKDNNNVIAEVQGIRCRAIFNPFAGQYFVDDLDGRIEEGGAQ